VDFDLSNLVWGPEAGDSPSGWSKEDVVNQIARLLNVPPPPMSTGSKEPRKIFQLVNDRLGLGLDESLVKQDLARGIVEASGQSWYPDYDSRGGTVTKEGLFAVLAAVEFFLH
jgi:hypothetical protein